MRIVKPDELIVFLCRRRTPQEKLVITLTNAPVAPLLDRLFTEADAAHPMTNPAFASISSEERLRLMRSRADYRNVYAQ